MSETEPEGDTSSLDKAIPRALFGAPVDVYPALVLKETRLSFHPNGSTPELMPFGAPRFWLFITAQITAESACFLAANGITSAPGVAPRQDKVPIDALADWIGYWLQP